MLGLAYRDMVIYWRRSSKKTYIYYGALSLFLLFAAGKWGAATFVFFFALSMMTGAPVILREADITHKGGLFSMSLPCSAREIVQGRFLAAFAVHLPCLASMVIFCGIHALYYQQYSPEYYVKLILCGWIAAILMTAVSLPVSFAGGIVIGSVVYMIMFVLILGGYLVIGFADIDLGFLLAANEWLLIAGGFALGLLTAAVCFVISVKIYERQKR